MKGKIFKITPHSTKAGVDVVRIGVNGVEEVAGLQPVVDKCYYIAVASGTAAIGAEVQIDKLLSAGFKLVDRLHPRAQEDGTKKNCIVTWIVR